MDEEEKLKSLDIPTEREAIRRYEKRKKTLRILLVILAVISLAGMIYGAIEQAPAPGEVTVTLEARYSAKNNPFAYFVHVPVGASLKDALLESGMITGEDTEAGFVVRKVGDISADPAKGESWTITRREEALPDSPEKVAIEQDTHFELILTPLPNS